ncbi:MAG: potassium channel family protein [Halobacteriota archaeon]
MVPLPSLPDFDLSRRYRHIVVYVLGLALMVFSFTVLYNLGMRTFEGEADSIFHSFQIVIETMTTTGYGADSPWETPIMNLFIVLMQLSGILIAFFTLRLIVIPLFSSAEVDLDDRLSPKHDHVIVCEYRRQSDVLLDELETLGIEYVLVSPSKTEAKRLSDAGYDAIDGSPHERHTFERAGIESARAVVTDAGDETVSAILTVRSIDPEIEVIALTDDSSMREVLIDSGADSVFSPHSELGHRLGEMAVSSFRATLSDSIDLGGHLELIEVPVHPGSQLVGTQIRDTPFRAKANAMVVGVYHDGEMTLPADPDQVIEADQVLLVAGPKGALVELSEYARPSRGTDTHERVVVAGMGEVGTGATVEIEAAGLDAVTIDVEDRPDVDIVGDVGSRETLREAGLETADALVVGVPEDAKALLTTVLARSLAPSIEIFVRVRNPETTAKAMAAGADFVLSVPHVSARQIANDLRGTQLASLTNEVHLIHISAAPFAGSSLAELELRERTGCLVVAIDRPDGTGTVPDPTYEFSGEETLAVVGKGEDIQHLGDQYDIVVDV